MTTLERRVEHLEKTIVEVLPAHTAAIEGLQRDVRGLQQDMQILARFLKRRLDPHDQDDDADFYELTK